MKEKNITEKTLSLLLAGKHPLYKKYEGKHVLVVGKKVLPLKEGREALENIDQLEKEYGEKPIIAFVPRQDISYIPVLLGRMGFLEKLKLTFYNFNSIFEAAHL